MKLQIAAVCFLIIVLRSTDARYGDDDDEDEDVYTSTDPKKR